MKISNRFLAIIGTILLVLLLGTSLTLAYDRQLTAFVISLDNQARETLLHTAQLKIDFYEKKQKEITQELEQKTQELETRQSELELKRAELDKTNQELTTRIKELNAAKSQLSANAAELSKLRGRPPLFTFKVESSSLENVEQKKEDIKQLVTSAYEVIEQVYSQPYLLNSVTITFVDSFSNPNAAAEIVIANGPEGLQLTIKIKDFNKNDFNDVNAIIHEIVHSFHGLAVLDPVAYEEGITVAASDAVMERLISQGKITPFNPLYIRISASEYANSELTLPRGASTLYNSSQVAEYYQLAGYGWYQIYKADSNFFKTFNEKIYATKREGKEINEQFVLDTIKSSTNAAVQGQSISSWLNTKAFVLQ